MNAETEDRKGVISPFTIYSVMVDYPTAEALGDIEKVTDFLKSNGATVDVLDAFNRLGDKIKRGVLE